MIVNILPKQIVKTYTVEKIDISISDLKLNENVVLNTLLISDTGELIDSVNFTLEGEEYQRWSSDDTYIIDLVCEKLGLEKTD